MSIQLCINPSDQSILVVIFTQDKYIPLWSMSLVTTKRSYPNGSFSGLVHSFKVPSPLFHWFKSSSPTAEIIARFNLCLDSFVKWFELCPFIKYWNKHWNSYQFPYLGHSPWNEYVQWYHSNAFSEVLCSMPGLLAQFRDHVSPHKLTSIKQFSGAICSLVYLQQSRADHISKLPQHSEVCPDHLGHWRSIL